MRINQPKFIKTPWIVFNCKLLKPSAKWIYTYLLFKEGFNHPWIKTIVNDTGIPYGTIRRDLRRLEAIGFIQVKHKSIKRNGIIRTHNEYHIIGPRC